MPGILYLLPTPLAEGRLDQLPMSTVALIARLQHFGVESLKEGRRMVVAARKQLGSWDGNLEPVSFFEIENSVGQLGAAEALLNGHDLGLMSDAGAPAVADPGHLVVARAQQEGVRVVPLSGPSSIIMSLMASGLNGQQFTFHGYLPRQEPARVKALKALELETIRTGYTQVLIETPYRNQALLHDALYALDGHTLLSIMLGIGTPDEHLRTLRVAQWRALKPELPKVPAVFLIGKP